jgi:hypothetical protein
VCSPSGQERKNRNRDRRAPATQPTRGRGFHLTTAAAFVWLAYVSCYPFFLLLGKAPASSPAAAARARPIRVPTGGRHRDYNDEFAPRRAMKAPPPAVSGDPRVSQFGRPVLLRPPPWLGFSILFVSSSLPRVGVQQQRRRRWSGRARTGPPRGRGAGGPTNAACSRAHGMRRARSRAPSPVPPSAPPAATPRPGVGGGGAAGGRDDGVTTWCAAAAAARIMCFVSRLLRANLVGVLLNYLVSEDLMKLTYNSNILNGKHVYVNSNGPFWPEGQKSINLH